jgi:hypothetical protein
MTKRPEHPVASLGDVVQSAEKGTMTRGMIVPAKSAGLRLRSPTLRLSLSELASDRVQALVGGKL